jgi:hypothetical protein
MIEPSVLENTISYINMVCITDIPNKRQYNFVEILIIPTSNNHISIGFYTPTDCKDESLLIEKLGCNIVDDTLGIWGSSAQLPDRTNVPSETKVVINRIQTNKIACEVSGCSNLAILEHNITGNIRLMACWSHEASDRFIVIPTENEDLSEWCINVVVFGSTFGTESINPMDEIISKFKSVGITPDENAKLIISPTHTLPFCNLWIPRFTLPPDSREYYGITGCHLVDETSFRVINFIQTAFVTMPTVCGCFIRRSPTCFVPLTITGRMTCKFPIIFKDSQTNAGLVDVYVNMVKAFYINTTIRHEYCNLKWVTLIPHENCVEIKSIH